MVLKTLIMPVLVILMAATGVALAQGARDETAGDVTELYSNVKADCYGDYLSRWLESEYRKAKALERQVEQRPELQTVVDGLFANVGASAIMSWAYNGGDWVLSRPNDTARRIGDCYEFGDCGLPKDPATAEAIRRISYYGREYYAEIAEPSDHPADYKLPALPPRNAYAWALEHAPPACKRRYQGYPVKPFSQLPVVDPPLTEKQLPAFPFGADICPHGVGLEGNESWEYYDEAIHPQLKDHWLKNLAWYYILGWADAGSQKVFGPGSRGPTAIAYCYEHGDCGLQKDPAKAQSIRQNATATVSFLPPQSAYAWARSQHDNCVEELPEQVGPAPFGRGEDMMSRRGPVDPFAAKRKVENLAAMFASGKDVADELAAAILTLSPPDKFQMMEPGGPLHTITTDRQKGYALAAMIDFWDQPNNVNSGYYGLRHTPAEFVDAILPSTPEPYATKVRSVLASVRAAQSADQARYARIDALQGFLNGAKLVGTYGSPSAQSGGSSVYDQQMDAYLYGKASRPPCTTSNPCGPGNQFQYFPGSGN